jgi:NCK adaptor protein
MLAGNVNSLLSIQELSEYLTQPYRNRDGGSERQDSLDRRQDGSGSGVGRLLDRPHLVGKGWYYGTITRAQCDNLLNQHGHDGDFLIRDSETNVSILILGVCILLHV